VSRRTWTTVGVIAVVVLLAVAVAFGGGHPISGPPAGADGDLGRGEILYEGNCARCHGEDARGTDQGPPFLHPFYRPAHHSDAAFFSAVRNGVRPHHWNFGSMPPIPGLSDQDIADIVAYVRSLQRAAGIR